MGAPILMGIGYRDCYRDLYGDCYRGCYRDWDFLGVEWDLM